MNYRFAECFLKSAHKLYSGVPSKKTNMSKTYESFCNNYNNLTIIIITVITVITFLTTNCVASASY